MTALHFVISNCALCPSLWKFYLPVQATIYAETCLSTYCVQHVCCFNKFFPQRSCEGTKWDMGMAAGEAQVYCGTSFNEQHEPHMLYELHELLIVMDCHDYLPYDLSHEICGWLPSVELQLCWYNSATVIIIAVHRIPSRIERVMDAYKKLWDDLESMTFDPPQDFMLWHDLIWLLDEMHNLPPYLLFKCSDV